MTDSFPSITVLVPNLKLGDENAWNELVEKFHVGMLAKARSLLRNSNLQRREDPEDLVQDSIRKAWQQHHTFRGETTAQFAKWVLTVLRNTFVDKCRPKNKETTGSWLVLTAGTPSPSQIALTNEDEAHLHACIAELKSEYRQVVVMRNLDGLKFREIADRLDSETSTIAGIHRRALAQLTQLMKERVGSAVIDLP